MVETMDRIREAAPPVLDTLQPEVRAIVARCLARDPENRFPGALALHRALAEALRSYPCVTAPDLGAWVVRVLAEDASGTTDAR